MVPIGHSLTYSIRVANRIGTHPVTRKVGGLRGEPSLDLEPFMLIAFLGLASLPLVWHF